MPKHMGELEPGRSCFGDDGQQSPVKATPGCPVSDRRGSERERDENDLIELTLIGDDGTQLVLSSTNPVSFGQSVTIAWTVVRWATPIKDNDVKLYANGFLQETGEIRAVQPNRNPVQLGNDDVPPFGTRPLKGIISQVRFYNVALNADELIGSWPAMPP